MEMLKTLDVEDCFCGIRECKLEFFHFHSFPGDLVDAGWPTGNSQGWRHECLLGRVVLGGVSFLWFFSTPPLPAGIQVSSWGPKFHSSMPQAAGANETPQQGVCVCWRGANVSTCHPGACPSAWPKPTCSAFPALSAASCISQLPCFCSCYLKMEWSRLPPHHRLSPRTNSFPSLAYHSLHETSTTGSNLSLLLALPAFILLASGLRQSFSSTCLSCPQRSGHTSVPSVQKAGTVGILDGYVMAAIWGLFIVHPALIFMSFIFLKIYLSFNWRIIALQNFVFCQTLTWMSHRCTYVPSLLSLPPLALPIPPP